MKNNKGFLYAILSLLSISSLVACSSGGNQEEEWEEPVYEIGDTVKEWSSKKDSKELPMGFPKGVEGSGEIDNKFGNEDKSCLLFNAETDGYIASDLVEEPYFTHEDAKNGDIISLYVYAPEESNINTLSIEAIANDGSSFVGNEIKFSGANEGRWIKSEVVFDTFSILSSIRLNYKAVDKTKTVQFYVDDINITYGEETQANDYVSNDESLKKSFNDYFRIGCCMSENQLGNTKMRQVVKENFNSVTAENEAKPEKVLDQQACQALQDKTKVVIKTAPFEKLYDWCEAHHIGVRHHTLVWYSQTPGWFFTEDYTNNGAQVSRETMLKRMDDFIRTSIETVNNRWPGLVYAIDVCNEAIENGGAGYNKNNKWFDTIGEDFVYQAFKFASRYKDDGQDLYYNDYACDYNTSNLEFALNGFLKDAIDEQLVDGIGLQGHIDCDNTRQTLANAKLIKEKGLKCEVTELDITTNGSDETSFNRQKEAYKALTKGILEGNAKEEMDVNAFIVWGITDDTSWKRNQNPLLFTSSYLKKPAYYGMLDALEEFEETNS
ncbi:MAG: endo-1,4-beta-xylanase [Bacilli bacterium]|nr:endo-1,4-beta-xylanase [Bacilli bacterium]